MSLCLFSRVVLFFDSPSYRDAIFLLGGGLNFAQHVKMAANYGNNKNIAGKDPREELFKYNEGKNYASQAYEGNIQKILADKTVEEEEAELKSGKRQKTK